MCTAGGIEQLNISISPEEGLALKRGGPFSFPTKHILPTHLEPIHDLLKPAEGGGLLECSRRNSVLCGRPIFLENVAYIISPRSLLRNAATFLSSADATTGASPNARSVCGSNGLTRARSKGCNRRHQRGGITFGS
jgi:hypothetical protein